MMQLTGKQISITKSGATSHHPDSHKQWVASPHLAFSDWQARRGVLPSTKIVYSSMFGQFLKWLKKNRIRIDRCTHEQMQAFLATATTDKHYRLRFMRLLRATYDHMADVGCEVENPALKRKTTVTWHQNDDSRFLTQAERESLIAYIETRLDEIRKNRQEESWMEIRDIAMIGVMMGGGMKVGQVKDVPVNCILLDKEELLVPGPGATEHPHRAVLLPFARPWLEAWMKELVARGRIGKEGDLPFFQADRSSGGKRPQRGPATSKIHASSIYRRTNLLLDAAGIKGPRACAQTLRNTYAAILIDQGEDNANLVKYLGLSRDKTAQQLRDTYAKQQLKETTHDQAD